MDWIATVVGLDDAGGSWYLWWSGFASDLGLIAAAVTIIWKHNCPVKGCNRLGKFPAANGYYVCAKHHPTGAPSADDMKEGQ